VRGSLLSLKLDYPGGNTIVTQIADKFSVGSKLRDDFLYSKLKLIFKIDA
jgi:hypothetical protein